jgi:hypothetical protein
MYPRNHPDLEDVPFEDLAAVAEAVEKYQVFPAMNICKPKMRCVEAFASQNPI